MTGKGRNRRIRVGILYCAAGAACMTFVVGLATELPWALLNGVQVVLVLVCVTVATQLSRE